MKKLICLVLCLVMALSVLAGCGGPATGEENDATESKMGKKAPEGYTLKIGIPTNMLVSDYETNALTKWLEEESGYNLDFVKYNSSAADYTAQIATEFMVPDVKMPDILIGVSLGQQAAMSYGENGLIVNLAPYFNDSNYSKVWWDRLNEIEDKDFVDFATRKLYVEGKDTIYIFPTVERNTYDMIRHQAFINQEWLDKLNLPMPTNTEELYNTLVAFKNQDPNGNNKKDEIPLIGRATDGYGDLMSWIINMFCYYEDARPWRIDDNGKLSGFFWDDNYRKALIFMNKLVKEGLMPDSIFTMTSDDLSSLVMPFNGVETVGVWLGHPTIVLTDGCEAVDVYKALPQWGNAIMSVPVFSWDGAVITTDCEYPDAAWEILMLLCTEEGAYRMRYGEKGVDWIEAAPGSKSFAGLDAHINVLRHDAYGGETTSTWNFVKATVGLANENERTELSDNLTAWNKGKLTMMGDTYKANWDAYNAKGGRPKDVVMPLIYTADEENEVSVYRNNTTNWFKTNRANFIKGVGEFNDPSNDAQWQAYIDGFKAANYYDWLQVAQDIYEYTYGDKAGK